MIPAPEPLPSSLDSGGKVHGRDGSVAPAARLWVPEAPVARIQWPFYAVMMATPSDLADYATGFAMAEGLITHAAQMGEIGVAHLDIGWILRAQIDGLDAEKLSERVRARVAESSCGLCGMEEILRFWPNPCRRWRRMMPSPRPRF
jgi:FdhD protein